MNDPQTSDPRETLSSSTGQSLRDLSADRLVLVAFLRHSGCTFCRSMLADISAHRQQLNRAGTGIVLVHLERDEDVARLAEEYGLSDVPRIADPQQQLYETFQLRRMAPLELLNPVVWLKGFRTALLERHGFGRVTGDLLQMPGVFLVRDGQPVAGYRHRTPASSCDIEALISEAATASAVGGRAH